MTTTFSSSEHHPQGDEDPPDEALLLGWAGEQMGRFGFAGHRDRDAEQQESSTITYGGDAHLLTIASTGSGKGRGVIIPNLLKVRRPFIVIDPKGENYQVTAQARRDMGHRVVKLDPFNVIDDGTPSDRLNPLDLFDLPNIDVESEAQMLANMMSLQNRGVKDPFWDEHGCGLLSGVIAAMVTTKEGDDKNLDAVFGMLMSDDCVYNLAVLLDTLGKKLPKMAYREIASFLQLPERDTRGSVLATTNSYIKCFLAEPVLSTLRTSSFALPDVVSGEPLDIFLILPSDKLKSHRGLLRMWVGTLLKSITSRRHIPQQRTVFLIDECAQLEDFAFLETVITLCRGYGLQCWTFWQDLAQLKTYYPRSWETIINNAGVIQAFGARNYGMATQIGNLLNVNPSEFLQLPTGEQQLLMPGQPSQRSRLFDYLNDEPFKGLWTPNRFFDGNRQP